MLFGRQKRYKIYPYSFKKFAFTKMADVLEEMVVRAIKGDKEYVFTYYRKSREERADDYRRVLPNDKVIVECANTTNERR